jgi:malonyl-CoA/methylmalonyl-CoA synthetase
MRPAWTAHLPAGVDRVDLLAHGTLVAAWTRNWSEEPARQLVHTSSRGWLTAGALERESRLVAGRLHGVGLRKGDRILLSAPASPTLVIAQVAALRLGLVLVPANPAYRDRELKHLVKSARPRAALVTGQAARHWVRAADPSVAIAGPAVDLPDWPSAPPGLDEVAPADPGLLVYTSGTTGAAKGALHTHGSLLASAEAVRIAWRWTQADRLILALPLFHVHGLCVGLFGSLLAGGSILLQQEFAVDAVLDAASREGATLFFGVPTMYARLAASPRVGELGPARLLVSGSAPLAPALFEAIAAGTGHRVLERYGMSETLMNISNPVDGERRPGSVGLPLPGVEVDLAGDGEILLRGPNLCAGYWENPEATAAAFTADGWFKSGDLAERAADGYITIVGRSKELIISGGFNVHPREVEEVLLAHPEVAEVAVAGTPSDEWGETVTAYVVPRGSTPPDAAELIAFAAARLATYKRPRAVHFVTGLPRNALGKVIRTALRPP